MIEKEINIGKLKILGQKCDESDNADLYSLFNSWLSFKNLSKKALTVYLEFYRFL